jgi:uncharacterized membrane protein
MAYVNVLSRDKRPFSWQLAASGYLVGIGLAGFFDGILLHQVLQWHHLLSLVASPAVQDIRTQILADGLFHVLMYIVTAIGLGFLWKSRHEFSRPSAGRWLLGTVVLGFGLWNVIDVGVFHWILRIHRIRVNSPDPLFWDLLWLGLFGLLFLLAGWVVRSTGDADDGPKVDRSGSIVTSITFVMFASGILAALPPRDSTATVVMFKPGIAPNQVFKAFDAADVRVLWADPSGALWTVKTTDSSNTLRLYRHGAMLVSSSLIGTGCFSWLRT